MCCELFYGQVYYIYNNNNNNGTIPDSTRSTLPTCFWLKAWAEPPSPQIRLRPRKVGVAPPTMGLSNEGRPADRAMEPSHQEARGEKRNRSHLKRVAVIVATAERLQSWWRLASSAVLVAIGFVCGSGGLVSVVVCGPLRWLLVEVAAELPGTWAMDFRSWV